MKEVKKKSGHYHSPMKHIFHMVLCCGLPILIIAFLPLISKYSPVTSGLLVTIALFICPLIMIPMMITMFKGNKNSSCCDDKNITQDLKKTIE